MEYNKIYQGLNNFDAAALNETIMDAGITSFPELEAAWNQAIKFLDEQPDSDKLSFTAFQATRVAKTWDQARCQEMGYDDESMSVLEYEDGCYIECCPDNMYYLLIGNQDWFDCRLEVLEQLLYDLWYC